MELNKPPGGRLLKPRVLTLDETLEHTPEELAALRSIGILPAIAGGAVTAKVYGNYLLGLGSSTPARWVDWAGDTINLALVTGTYTPNQDTDTYWGDAGISSTAGVRRWLHHRRCRARVEVLVVRRDVERGTVHRDLADHVDVRREQGVPVWGAVQEHGHGGHEPADRVHRLRRAVDHG